MEESRASKLARLAKENKVVVEERKRRKEELEKQEIERKERAKIKKLVDTIRAKAEIELESAVENGSTYFLLDFKDYGESVYISSCKKYQEDIVELCKDYQDQGFKVRFVYEYHNACGSTAYNSYTTSYFSLSFGEDDNPGYKIDIGEICM